MGDRPDLRSFLAWVQRTHPEALLRIEQPLRAEHEISALQLLLERHKRYPVIFVANPTLFDGTKSPFPVVTNLTASRPLCAQMLGIDPRAVAREYAARVANRIDPVEVSREEAPVKEVVLREDEIDLFRFPFPVHNEADPGPYIGSGFVTTVDPATGTDNCSIQRLWVREPRRLGYWPAPSSHNSFNLQKWWERGEPMPVAIWIGHHPAALAGAQARLGYPESHWPAVGGSLGEPLRLVRTELFGDLLKVPADAEMVLEGVVPPHVYAAEGPFGEFTGYAGPQRPSPVVEIKAVTYRRDMILHDIGVGTADHLVMLGNFQLEARLYQVVRQTIPDLLNVHVPLSGHRFHAYLQVRKERPGVGKAAILAALPVDQRLKHIVVVDEDIDIFDEAQVLWAIATRTQWDRDLIVIPNHPAYPLDPSLPGPQPLGAVGGIDATRPVPLGIGLPPRFWSANCAPQAVLERLRLEDFVDLERLEKMPGSF